jgi:hypothetical protein
MQASAAFLKKRSKKLLSVVLVLGTSLFRRPKMDKSFLLLFFKKAALACFPFPEPSLPKQRMNAVHP